MTNEISLSRSTETTLLPYSSSQLGGDKYFGQESWGTRIQYNYSNNAKALCPQDLNKLMFFFFLLTFVMTCSRKFEVLP